MAMSLIILRLVHITLGVFWAGTIFFFVLLLQPSVGAAGPAGGRVMQELIARGFLKIIPLTALLTILSGIGAMSIVSGGMSSEWMGSASGITYSIGGLAAIIALGIGWHLMRPTAFAMGALGGRLASADEESRGALQAEMGLLQAKARRYAVTVAVFLAVAVATMAVARYL